MKTHTIGMKIRWMLLTLIPWLLLQPPRPAQATTNPCGTYAHCVKLTWQWTAPNTDSWVFRVYRSEDGGTTYVKVASGMTATKWRDTNVIAGLTYDYYVTAYDKTTQQESGPSDVAPATIPSP